MKSFKRSLYKTLTESTELTTDIIACSDSIYTEGEIGVYYINVNIGTELGYTGIQYDSYSIPDRFQIIYDGNVVADSKYVGSTSYFDDLEGTYNPKVFDYINGAFVDSGNTEEVIVTGDDIADGSPSEPTSGKGIIQFNRQDRNSDYMTIKVTGILTATAWNLQSKCPQENPIEYANSYQLSYSTNISSIDCFSPTNVDTYYVSTTNLEVGTVIFIDSQRVNKAPSGYYLFGTRIYYYDGNTITDELACSAKP